MPCTYMKTHKPVHARSRAHTRTHNRIHSLACTHTRLYVHTHTGTSVQRTPSILNPDPGLVSVFTCKWYTTICGPFCLLCSSSHLGPGKRAGSQMEGPHQMGSHGYEAKCSEERGKSLSDWQPLKQQGLPHSMEVIHEPVSFFDWRAEERRKGRRKRPSCPTAKD